MIIRDNCIKKLIKTFFKLIYENINSMFNGCKSITEIDVINWDMSILKYSDKEN